MSAVTERTRRIVWERAESRCERCGRYLQRDGFWPHSLQHRHARKMGGSRQPWVNSPVNLGLVCGSATTRGGCHELLESNRDRERNKHEGWVLPSGSDPARVPVLLWDGRWAFLTADGGYSNLPEVAA